MLPWDKLLFFLQLNTQTACIIMLRNSALKRVSSCMMKETALQQICSLSPLIHRGCLRDMVDQWRHRGLWQRYWHWSPHTAVEAGWSDSWGSHAEAGHDKSALYFRASGGKEKHPISTPTPTKSNPDNVAASALSYELHLKPLSHFLCVWSHVTKDEWRISSSLLCQSAHLVLLLPY